MLLSCWLGQGPAAARADRASMLWCCAAGAGSGCSLCWLESQVHSKQLLQSRPCSAASPRQQHSAASASGTGHMCRRACLPCLPWPTRACVAPQSPRPGTTARRPRRSWRLPRGSRGRTRRRPRRRTMPWTSRRRSARRSTVCAVTLRAAAAGPSSSHEHLRWQLRPLSRACGLEQASGGGVGQAVRGVPSLAVGPPLRVRPLCALPPGLVCRVGRGPSCLRQPLPARLASCGGCHQRRCGRCQEAAAPGRHLGAHRHLRKADGA